MTWHRTTMWLTVGALAISLGLAACGSNGGQSANTPAQQTPAAAAASATDLTVTLHVEGMT